MLWLHGSYVDGGYPDLFLFEINVDMGLQLVAVDVMYIIFSTVDLLSSGAHCSIPSGH